MQPSDDRGRPLARKLLGTKKNRVPSLNTNNAESIASMQKIRQMIAMYKAPLFINHDKKPTDKLKPLPAIAHLSNDAMRMASASTKLSSSPSGSDLFNSHKPRLGYSPLALSGRPAVHISTNIPWWDCGAARRSSMSDLKGKVAVVTGASKGIGAAIAKGLSAAGAAVVVNYSSSKEGADRVVADINANGGKAIAVKGDVAKAVDMRRLFDETEKAFGTLDVLVNNAGVYKFLPLEDITDDEFHREFNINVLGTILATKEAVKHFGPNGGSVINIKSTASAGVPTAVLFRDQRRGRCNNTWARRGTGSTKNPDQRYCAGRRRDRGDAQRRHRRQRFREDDDRRHAAGSLRTAGRHRPHRRVPCL